MFAVYTGARIREGSTDVGAGQVVCVVLGVAVLTVPVALELLALWHRQRDWLIPNPLTVSWVGQMLVPPALVGALVLAVLFRARKLRLSSDPRRLPRSTLILLLGWFLIPSGVLVGLAIVSPVRLIMARYLMIAAPGGVLLAALLLRSLEPASVRRIVILVFAILCLLTFSTPVKSGDFRGAAELVRSVSWSPSNRAGTAILNGKGFSLRQLRSIRFPARSCLFRPASMKAPWVSCVRR